MTAGSSQTCRAGRILYPGGVYEFALFAVIARASYKLSTSIEQ